MNYLDPLPIIRLKKKNRIKSNPNILPFLKKLIVHPYKTINNYNHYYDKYKNVYGKTLVKSKIGTSIKDLNKEKTSINTKNIKININTKNKELLIRANIIDKKPNKINQEKKVIMNRFLKTFYDKFKNNNFENIDININNKNKRKSLLKIKSKVIDNINKTENFDIKENIKKLKNDNFNLNNAFNDKHPIIKIINKDIEFYNKIIKQRKYNILLSIFHLKYCKFNNLILINSMSLEINNSVISIPFSLSYFLIKYSNDYLIKFMKELIFLLFRRKLKGFKKSILNFEDFYTINKQIINNSIDKYNSLKEVYQIIEIPKNNSKIRKSLFFNNPFNNNIIEDSIKELNSKKNFNSKNKPNNSNSDMSSSLNSNISSNSSDSSFDECDIKEIKDKNKLDNLNKMALVFENNFNKSKKTYKTKINYPLAHIYDNLEINDKDKFIFKINCNEIQDLISLNKDKINHLIERVIQ